MPLSELYRLAKGKVETTLQESATCSVDPSSIPDNDFFELVWENGQILTQGQSSKGRKVTPMVSYGLPSHDLPSHIPKYRDKESVNGTNSKSGRFGNSVLNDFPLSVPTDEMGDDDMVTWLNYPIDDQLNHDYCSDLLTELSGVTVNDISMHNNFSSESKRSSGNHASRDLNSVSLHTGMDLEQGSPFKVSIGGGCPTTSVNSQVYPLSSTQCQTSFPSFRSRVSDVITNSTSNSTQNAGCGDINHIQASSSVLPSMRIQKQDPGPSTTSSGFMNFSHFSRPAAMVKANLDSIGARGNLDPASLERMPNKGKGSAVTSGYPVECTLMDSSGVLEKDVGSHSQAMGALENDGLKLSMNKQFVEQHPTRPRDSICREDAAKSDKSPDQVMASNANKAIPAGDKTTEPAVASSVCSGNSAERASNDPTKDLKRKHGDTEDIEYTSDGVEEDSGGIKKATPARGGTGSKRSRAAEVHNLSERRRRDRINEKMRALQELIPNCNKVDKASMLDEAIEYLKTLQLQVQIMSMGTGMCMPPMMFPPGMQHIHPAHMPRFSPMGVGMGLGMGMGMGYGMGMLDITGGSPGCPVIQMPPMQGARFPGPPISAMPNLHGMPGSNLPMFGLHGQRVSMSVPHAPVVPFSAATSIRPTVGLNTSVPGSHIGNVALSQATSSKDPMQNISPQVVQNIDVNRMCSKTATQCLETKVCEQSASLRNNDQSPDVNRHGAVN